MTLDAISRNPVFDLQPGRMVTEHVRLVRQIGEGGMGSVWLADHLGLDTQIAVKFMAPALASYPAAVERFTREAKAAARIHHPNVVQIIDSGAPGDSLPYIMMEYLEGTDLETRVQERGRLSLELAATVVHQTAKALEKAHELGVVHRDVKPENIFLCGDDEDPFVKVLDFGIAKQEQQGGLRVTNTGATLGTPNYMSPEQMLSAKNVDYKCDLWALAVVAYFCVTGRLPFEGETYGAICLAVNRGKFRLPSRLRRSIPQALDDWFLRALARDPRKRFRSARELGEAFVTAVEGAPPGIRRGVTPFSARGTLMGSSITANPEEGGTRRYVVPAVAAMALVAGALLAVLFGRGLLAEPTAVQPAAAAAVVAPVLASPEPTPELPTVVPQQPPILVVQPAEPALATSTVSANADASAASTTRVAHRDTSRGEGDAAMARAAIASTKAPGAPVRPVVHATGSNSGTVDGQAATPKGATDDDPYEPTGTPAAPADTTPAPSDAPPGA